LIGGNASFRPTFGKGLKNFGEIGSDDLRRSREIGLGVSRAKESRLELRWRKINALLEATMKEFAEARFVAAHGLLQVP